MKKPTNIVYNKPYIVGKEIDYIRDAVESGKLSGNGKYTKLCQSWFEQKYGIKKALLTSSCTDALEMIAILLDLKNGDEVIMPSYTFVSTANAFILHGAKVVFADSCPDHPNMSVESVKEKISPRTRAIVAVHYAGNSCDMDGLSEICAAQGLILVEDAAQGIESTYHDKPLGSIGHLSAFSFHETKNVIAGEGGLLAINDERFSKRAEIIWEKGTNRSAFFRGEVQKYEWVDVGSSFLPSELVAAFLYAQLEKIDLIQSRRIQIWSRYYEGLQDIAIQVGLPTVPDYATVNGHIFYLICKDSEQRDELISHLKRNGVLSVFHYLPLHLSPFHLKSNDRVSLPFSEKFGRSLIRLPLFFEMTDQQVDEVIEALHSFFNQHHEVKSTSGKIASFDS